MIRLVTKSKEKAVKERQRKNLSKYMTASRIENMIRIHFYNPHGRINYQNLCRWFNHEFFHILFEKKEIKDASDGLDRLEKNDRPFIIS